MHAAAFLLVALGAQPSPALAIAFRGELRLTLGTDDDVPPPPLPPLVQEPPPPAPPEAAPPPAAPPPSAGFAAPPLILQPPPPPPPPEPASLQGSRSKAFWLSYTADFFETGVMVTGSLLGLVLGSFAISPPCGGSPNLGLGIPLLIVSVAVFLAQPFAVAETTRAIFEAQNYHLSFWALVGWDALSLLVAAPLLALLGGGIGAAVNDGTVTATLAIGLGALSAPLGAPLAGYLTTAPKPAPAAGAPLVRLAF